MERDTARLFGIYVKEQRLLKKWSQEDLAQAAGLGGYQAIMEIEMGRAVPNINKAYAIAQALGVSLTHLTGEPQPPASEIRTVAIEGDPWHLSFRVFAFLNEIKSWDKTQRDRLLGVFQSVAHFLEGWPVAPETTLQRETGELLDTLASLDRPEEESAAKT